MSSLSLFNQLWNGLTPSSPVVMTMYGPVEGTLDQSRSGENFYHFKGIPYAKPPVGDLRFKAPQPPEKWKEVKKTKMNQIFCLQMMTVMFPHLRSAMPPMGSEDCLHLSVATRSLSPKTKRPVLVYFHGGAFIALSGPNIWTPAFLMDSDQVVVMVNYRLSMLGFMSFEDDVVPGNMGLKDQNLALRWVRDNIKNFGGDLNRVTIIGESAGAASVHYHTLSPMSKGLFHQVIPLSGTAYATWAYAYPGDARALAFQFAKHVGCRGANSSVLVDCMKKISAYNLVRSTVNFFGIWDLEPSGHIGPVFEKKRPGSFAPSSTKKWKPISVPMLVGVTNGEGLLKTIFYKSPIKSKSWHWISKNWDDIMAFSLRFRYNPRYKEITKNMRDYWFAGRNELRDTDLGNFTDLYSIAAMVSPLMRMVEEAKSKVYLFNFNYLGESSPSTWINDPSLSKMTFHAETLVYVMRSILYPAHRGQDLEISKNLTRMITNFVKFGDPTPESGMWKPFNNETYDALLIDNNGTRMVSGGLPEDVKYWRSLCAFEKFFGCTV
ncbi:hypothetical protein GE061_003461 [Apolygus lucorum]|uniref:Carboxylic ester hydrolase n=1 Tax=Apolygus lucorum TaxID=248454 RepID=A0A8S9X3W4_APOLU|nr:hypothetical protein GE061_003461 [Apolygus lucorum]